MEVALWRLGVWGFIVPSFLAYFQRFSSRLAGGLYICSHWFPQRELSVPSLGTTCSHCRNRLFPYCLLLGNSLIINSLWRYIRCFVAHLMQIWVEYEGFMKAYRPSLHISTIWLSVRKILLWRLEPFLNIFLICNYTSNNMCKIIISDILSAAFLEKSGAYSSKSPI